MALVSGRDEVIDELAKALKLPKYTTGFELRAYKDEIVTVKCEYFLDLEPDEMGTLTRLLSEFALTKVEDKE